MIIVFTAILLFSHSMVFSNKNNSYPKMNG